MNYYNREHYQKIVDKMAQDTIDIFGEERVFGVFLYGSQNYGCATEHSDVDVKAIILPSWEDILHRDMERTKVIELKEGNIEARDIRNWTTQWKKQNINMLEILFTKWNWINPMYRKEWDKLRRNKEDIAHYDIPQAMKAMFGMAKRKYEEMFHDTPAHHEDIVNYGYARKEFTHLARHLEFMTRYSEDVSYEECIESEISKELIALKEKAFPIEEVRAAAAQIYSEIKQLTDEVVAYGETAKPNKEVESLLDDVVDSTMRNYLRRII